MRCQKPRPAPCVEGHVATARALNNCYTFLGRHMRPSAPPPWAGARLRQGPAGAAGRGNGAGGLTALVSRPPACRPCMRALLLRGLTLASAALGRQRISAFCLSLSGSRCTGPGPRPSTELPAAPILYPSPYNATIHFPLHTCPETRTHLPGGAQGDAPLLDGRARAGPCPLNSVPAGPRRAARHHKTQQALLGGACLAPFAPAALPPGPDCDPIAAALSLHPLSGADPHPCRGARARPFFSKDSLAADKRAP
jgi:hypothetical protein